MGQKKKKTKRKGRPRNRLQMGTWRKQVKVRTQVLDSERECENTGYKSAEAAGVLKISPRHVLPVF